MDMPLSFPHLLPCDDRFPFRMIVCGDQLLRQLVHFADSVLLRSHVLLELVELPLEDFHVLQVVTEFVGRHERFLRSYS